MQYAFAVIARRQECMVREILSLFRIFLVVLMCFCWGNALRETLVSEVATVRENNRYAVIDITMIAEKYIPSGVGYLAARNVLDGEGFEIFEMPNNEDGLQVIAKRKLETKGSLFCDEIKLIVVVENDRVKSYRGGVIYRSL